MPVMGGSPDDCLRTLREERAGAWLVRLALVGLGLLRVSWGLVVGGG